VEKYQIICRQVIKWQVNFIKVIEFHERRTNKMCIECRQDPCHPRCPNAPEVEPALCCSICGGGILPGDTYYDIDSKDICAECMDDSATEAEYPVEPDDDYEEVRFKEMRQGIL
jgi:hypothetical protein